MVPALKMPIFGNIIEFCSLLHRDAKESIILENTCWKYLKTRPKKNI